MVLDPFCGCATTPVAAERLGRQWVGMDLWAGAHRIVVSRLRQEKQIWRPEQVKLITVPPPPEPMTPSQQPLTCNRLSGAKNGVRYSARNG